MNKLQLTIIFLCFAYLGNSQFSIGTEISYGNAWQEYGDVDLPEDAPIEITAYSAKFKFGYQISKYYQLGISPGYARRGAACEPGFLVFNSDTKLLIDYLELGINNQLKFYILPERLFLAPSLSYSVSRAVKARRQLFNLSTGDEPIDSDIDIDNSEDFNKWEHGGYAALDLGVQVVNHSFYIQAGLYYGFRNVVPTSTSLNRSIFLSLGYSYSI